MFVHHLFDKLDKVLSVNSLPKLFLPCTELGVNKCNKIPHFLEIDEFVSAILELFVISSLQIEKGLKNLELTGFIFHFNCFREVVLDFFIRILNDFW